MEVVFGNSSFISLTYPNNNFIPDLQFQLLLILIIFNNIHPGVLHSSLQDCLVFTYLRIVLHYYLCCGSLLPFFVLISNSIYHCKWKRRILSILL